MILNLEPELAVQIDAPPQAGCVLSVVIPVRDEEASLPATLAALAVQRDTSGAPLDPDCYEVILLVNNVIFPDFVVECF